MKIILIAYSYPPLREAQAIRWYYLSRELSKLGFDIDIITVRYPDSSGDSSSLDLPENIRIHRVFPGFFESLAFKTRELMSVDKNPEIRTKKSFKILKTFHRLFRKSLNNLLPGDIRSEWFPFAINFIKEKINIKNYDFLITSHEPYVDSLIGLYLKNRLPRIKWLADIADPFTAPYYPKWRRKIDEKFERRVLEKADIVTVTSESLMEHYIRKYGIDERKIFLIRQGFDLERAKIKEKTDNKILTLAYTGIFYKKRRDPQNLFSALSELDFDFKFIIAGRNEEFLPKDEKLFNKIDFLGSVNHFDSLNIQKSADLLIHLTYDDKRQVPGKFYEYLGSGTPILCITHNSNDDTAILTQKLNVGLVCHNDKKSIKEALKHFHKIWQLKEIHKNFNLNPEYFREFSWQNYAKLLGKIIQENHY